MRASARFVGPIERMLYLKSLPTLNEVPLDDLASVASFLEERFYKRGDILIPEDRPVDGIHFVVEGRVEVRWKGTTIAMVEPPFGVGFLGLLSGEPDGTLAIADTNCQTLRLDAETFLELTEEQFTIVRAGLRQTSQQFLVALKRLPISDEEPPMVVEEFGYPEEPFDLVERLVWMRETSAVFRDCNLDALAEICRHQRELRLGAGEVLWEAGDPSTWGFSIVAGRVRYTDAETGQVRRVGAGFSLGYPDCLASQPRTYDCVTETDCVLLRGEHAALVDVFEDHPHVVMQLQATLCKTLLNNYAEYGPMD